MSEIRYVEVLHGDGTTTLENPYKVSDEELYLEQLEKDCNDGTHAIKRAFDNWDSLSNIKKREIVKDILRSLVKSEQGRL